jgi:transposase
LLQGEHARLSTYSRISTHRERFPPLAEEVMERMFEVAAGIDVHRDTVVVAVRRRSGSTDAVQTRTFETFSDALIEMTAWLSQQGVEVVGLESTGVYWQPVVRAIQRSLPKVVVWLVNPAQVKKVPGRKTDVGDSQWLSKLVMYGLISPSFLPSLELQELRKLTRHRTKLTADQTRYKNRIIKEVESSGIKLASVCSDVLGKTARALLDAMVAGRTLDADAISMLAQGSLRTHVPQLLRAVQGALSPSTVLVLRQLLRRLDDVSKDICDLESDIQRLMVPMAAELKRLVEIPGINEVAAAAVLAEIGVDMSCFPSAKHLSSWGGLSPGSEESAGKSKHAPTRQGNKYLRTILVQVAMAAKNTKGTFWQSKFRRLARLGPKKAAVAVARSMLGVIFHMLASGTPYREPDTVPPPPHRLRARISSLAAQLESLGFKVSLTPSAQTGVS